MHLSIDDCDARILRYYEDFNGIVDDNGLQGLIGADGEDDQAVALQATLTTTEASPMLP